MLSVRQPWAWLIVNGFKDVENRPGCVLHRGPLLFQAGANLSAYTEDEVGRIERRLGVRVPDEFPPFLSP